MRDRDLASLLRQAGVARGDLVGLAVAPDGSAAVAAGSGGAGQAVEATGHSGAPGDAGQRCWVVSAGAVGRADAALRPRWATWSGETAARLAERGVRLATCWDIAALHRLLFGGWRADPGLAWAGVRGLPLDAVPVHAPGELFGALGAPDDDAAAGDEPGDEPVGAGAYLRPEWADGGWADSEARLARWAQLALEVARGQVAMVEGGRRLGTARSESTIELLCCELATDGLPADRTVAERLLAGIIGSRPRDPAEAARIRARRDEQVLRHAPRAALNADLRSPLQVKTLLREAGIDVPDTRAWRLEQYQESQPLVRALLEWRKAERIATTYGYAWLDACLGPDGRLRGSWTGSDGAAGRMTASAGLHNMPAVLRRMVIAEDGHVFIRADLGQIEPRVLAAVSGDQALIAATEADDLYLPVASQLGIDRPTAKVAMIAAMYGQTTGHGGQAARRMKAAYPVAMAYLDTADRQARAGHDLRTHGGRLVRMSGGDGQESSARVAARGRYGRNAMIQGAAAELFKIWAVTVRARGAALGARIVLCLHDELLVHVPEATAGDAATLVGDCLREAAHRWAPGSGVRFLADITTVRCWADAKDAKDAKDAGPAASPETGPAASPGATPARAHGARQGTETDNVTGNIDGQEGA